MEIILLGAGTAIPTPGCSPAAILVRSEQLTALLDIGPGAVHQLAANGFNPFDLQTVFLTHLHSDHTLDLATFLQLNDSMPGIQRTAPLHLIGCQGTQAFYEGLMRLYPGISPQTYPLDIREVAEETFELNGIHISTAFTGHTPESVGYRFNTPQGSWVYTGDCSAKQPMERFCTGADLLICECSFPAGWPPGDHMNADAIGQLAAQAGVKQLVVTHRYPPALKVDLAAEIHLHYPGPITIAQDGTKVNLNEKG